MDIIKESLPLDGLADSCQSPLALSNVVIIVVICCALGIAWAVFNFILVRRIDVEKGSDGESDSLVGDIPEGQKKLLIELGEKIANVVFTLFRELLNFLSSSTSFASFLCLSCLL